VTSDDGRVEILEQANPGTAAGAGVGRELQKIDLMRDRERPREIREEDDARLERRDEKWSSSLVSRRELLAELVDPAGDLLAGEVDLPRAARRREIRRDGQEASLSR